LAFVQPDAGNVPVFIQAQKRQAGDIPLASPVRVMSPIQALSADWRRCQQVYVVWVGFAQSPHGLKTIDQGRVAAIVAGAKDLKHRNPKQIEPIGFIRVGRQFHRVVADIVGRRLAAENIAAVMGLALKTEGIDKVLRGIVRDIHDLRETVVMNRFEQFQFCLWIV